MSKTHTCGDGTHRQGGKTMILTVAHTASIVNTAAMESYTKHYC